MAKRLTDEPTGLPLTGERTLPGIWHENYWFRRHEAAYRHLARAHADRLCGAVVLDAGAGEGYGGELLARAGARAVLGLDLDLPTLRHVATTYAGVLPVHANLVHLPCRSGSVDVVVSSQTVEHLWDQEAFVRECARALRPGGALLVTTPNRATFPPGNPFHSRELDPAELARLVATAFDADRVDGVHHGPRLALADEDLGGLVAAQLAAPPGEWADELRRAVRSVTADDFVVGPAEGSLDLVAVGIRR